MDADHPRHGVNFACLFTNGFTEAFNSKLRSRRLNAYGFMSLLDAR
ncbi:MAG: transposase [Flavobacteriaceae bacterium]|nr:transposase [Flavobacteriaceae bacterium]